MCDCPKTVDTAMAVSELTLNHNNNHMCSQEIIFLRSGF